MFPRNDKSYDKDSLQTPQWLFDWLNERYKFDRDAAADASNAKCEAYNTKEDSFLEYSPAHFENQTIFCNPPYSTGMIDSFINQAILAGKYNATTVFVIPTLNGEARSAQIVKYVSKITFFGKRVNFIKPNGEIAQGNNRGTMIVRIDNGGFPNPLVECLSLDKIKEQYTSK